MAPTPAEVVQDSYSIALNATTVKGLVVPDATHASLALDNPELAKIVPYSSVQTKKGGAEAVLKVFGTANKIWVNEDFKIHVCFDDGENVAASGEMTYRSKSLGKMFTSPFSVWAKVANGKVTYMQFLEDTLQSMTSFKVDGPFGTYNLGPETKEEIHV
jgi:uncharacterized protein